MSFDATPFFCLLRRVRVLGTIAAVALFSRLGRPLFHCLTNDLTLHRLSMMRCARLLGRVGGTSWPHVNLIASVSNPPSRRRQTPDSDRTAA